MFSYGVMRVRTSKCVKEKAFGLGQYNGAKNT